MSLTVSETLVGTKEEDWLAWPALSDFSAMAWGSPGRVVVLAPHPDDETLALGGTMQSLAREGHSISIVAITDGEASHPRSPSVTPEEMARIRSAERKEALTAMGLGHVPVTRLGCRDGAVAADRYLVHRLGELLAGASWCLAPWERDGHPDHDATGRAARAACAARGVRLVEYPIWAWHWARPSSPEVPWNRASTLPLTPRVLAAKERAIRAYRSQTSPLGPRAGDEAVLPAAVLARFQRPFEIVFA